MSNTKITDNEPKAASKPLHHVPFETQASLTPQAGAEHALLRLNSRAAVPAHASRLQRVSGNRHTARLIEARPARLIEARPARLIEARPARLIEAHTARLIEARPIQPKLRMGPGGDRYEREADRVADQIIATSPAPSRPQRVEEEEEVQLAPTLQQTGHSGERIQRSTGLWKKLPKLKKLTKTRIDDIADKNLKTRVQVPTKTLIQEALTRVDDTNFTDRVFQETVDNAKSAKQTLPTTGVMTSTIGVIKFQLLQAQQRAIGGSKEREIEKANANAMQSVANLSQRLNDGHDVARMFFVSKFFEKTKTYSEHQARVRQNSEFKYISPEAKITKDNVTKAFMDARDKIAITGTAKEYKTQKKAFATALEKMPTVRHLTAAKGKTPYKNRQKTEWKDGGNIRDNIQIVKEGLFKKEARLKDGAFKKEVHKADYFIRGIVEPQLLGMLKKPVIHAHTRYSQGLRHPFGFRAYQSGSAVHVAQDEKTPTIVHEIGHYLEKNLPSETWHDIHVLLRTRHASSGGGKRAKRGAIPAINEGRYGGEYEVTGKYTSRSYNWGSTEVMSMTLEFLSNPEKVKKMIRQDPQQAAVILRGIRPQEYANTNELRAFDKFLPG